METRDQVAKESVNSISASSAIFALTDKTFVEDNHPYLQGIAKDKDCGSRRETGLLTWKQMGHLIILSWIIMRKQMYFKQSY